MVDRAFRGSGAVGSLVYKCRQPLIVSVAVAWVVGQFGFCLLIG